MIDEKKLKKDITRFIERCGGNCSVALEHVDFGAHAFAEMPGWQVMRCRGGVVLFVPPPGAVTFVIPYKEVIRYVLYEDGGALNIELGGRQLISIRGLE